MSLLEASHLTRNFGSYTALDDFSLSVAAGEIVGLIGPSGGGKTTAVRLMCGIDRPDRGSVRLLGRGIDNLRMRERQKIAMLAQDPAIIPEFTIGEQVRLAAKLRGVRVELADILQRVGLADHHRTRLLAASGGMRRRAGLAATLVSDPELAFLDEPTAGLDPIIRDELWAWFRARRETGRAMVVTTQHIDEASRCDRVIVLRNGAVITDARPRDLLTESGLSERLVIRVAAADLERSRAVLQNRGLAPAQRRNELVVATNNAAQEAASVAELLSSNNVTVHSLDTEVPGLDEIFRSLVEQ